jgi:hypothetical protein
VTARRTEEQRAVQHLTSFDLAPMTLIALPFIRHLPSAATPRRRARAESETADVPHVESDCSQYFRAAVSSPAAAAIVPAW